MYEYHQRRLDNGVRILSKPLPGVSSASIGIWVSTGSRDELAKESGAAHFIEHMLFKGTQRHTAAQMAARMDAIGGRFDAFTAKESTCFYARALNSHLMEAIDILCGMFFEAKFDPADVETERGVILEEIGMYQDDPADLASERLAAAVFRGCPLARPILGKQATLSGMDSDFLRQYQASHYIPDRIVVVVTGSYPPEAIEVLAERFAAMPARPDFCRKKAVYRAGLVTLKRKATEQNQLLLAFPSLRDGDPRRFTMQLLSSALGGGMSSRLFQEVRERLGLCYDVRSFGYTFEDIGLFCLSTAVQGGQEQAALQAIRATVEEFAAHGITPEELNRVRELSKANVLMGLESVTSHMNHLARAALSGEEPLSQEEIIAAYDAVTCQQVQALAEETFCWERLSCSVVGRVADEGTYRQALGMD
jgi:predicted Zn-dependent peptidase